MLALFLALALLLGCAPACADDRVLAAEFVWEDAWTDNDKHYSKWALSVTNDSSSAVEGWLVTAELPEDSTIVDAWNCVWRMGSNSRLLLGNEAYNAAIEGFGSESAGFIVESRMPIVYIGDGRTEVPAQAVDYVRRVVAAPEPDGDDWLFAQGNRIVDKDGAQVWITGLNWFGYNNDTNAPDGLWSVNIDETLREIALRGFNTIRLPMSIETILAWSNGTYPAPNVNDYVNPELRGLNSLEVLDVFVDISRKYGLKIMLDMHTLTTGGMTHEWPLWYSDEVSEAEYLHALTWIVDRFKHDDTVIAVDLINEPRGIPGVDQVFAVWDSSNASNNWRAAALRAARAVLAVNPNILVVVEGVESYPIGTEDGVSYASREPSDYHMTWWGANLRGVKDHPIDLDQFQNKLVYSIHDYGPGVFGQRWFSGGFTFDSLMEDCWRDNWLFVHDEEIAPVWIGEWGGHMTGSNLAWMTHLRTLIEDRRLNHTFWCFNANSQDTGGLVFDDFQTWDEEKYHFVEPVLWKENGIPQGLDPDIALGGDASLLSE